MIVTFAGPAQPAPATGGEYVPGVCNIGPHEMAVRRRFGHLGVVLTVVALLVLVATRAPAEWRLVVGIPAAGAAAGYLQAWLQFCVAFGAGGVFNFGRVGQAQPVNDARARARDRARAWQILVTSVAAGVVVGVIAALLPI